MGTRKTMRPAFCVQIETQSGKEEAMALIKKPITGMKDILPKEMEIRTYVMNVIRDTYTAFGYDQIETPCVEHIENLCSKQGGDNEKLIFKILKRGEKLRLKEAESEEDLVDGGLRYDLTVPLARYFSNNQNSLPSPFKSLQMGNVWRADRPQRGRFRQFMQCDIDILGDPGNMAEVELITAITTVLGKLDFSNFTIRLNDRRILRAMAEHAGFAEESFESIFITLDKMDKIGLDGVKTELIDSGFEEDKVEKYLGLFDLIRDKKEPVKALKEELGDDLPDAVSDWLTEIMTMVEARKQAQFRVLFDPTLVRGMSYYTGTIFEVAMDEYGGSVGGGGRYDKMIGRFTGQDTPACGFSIGFERIVMLLMERNFKIPTGKNKVAVLLDKGLTPQERLEALREADEKRSKGMTVLAVTAKKNRKFQKEQLEKDGYSDIVEVFHQRES